MNDVQFNYHELEKYLDDLDKDSLNIALARGAALLEARVKERAPHKSGELVNSITSWVDEAENTAYCGTTLAYAPYVEFGTGAFAINGDGRPGYWVFVKGSSGSGAGGARKFYTLEEAKKVMAILRKKGLDAYYTQGQQPNPFLEDTVQQYASEVVDEIVRSYKEEVGL